MANLLGTAILVAVVVVSYGKSPVPFNDTNPLFGNMTFSWNVKLIFRTGENVIGPVCNRMFTVPASQSTVNVSASPDVPSAKIRVQPEIQIEGPASSAYYTLLIAAQYEKENAIATPTRPFIHYLVSNIQLTSRAEALPLSSYIPARPIGVPSEITVVMLLRQDGRLSEQTPLTPFVGKCGIGAGRCKFDVQTFAANYNMTLAFAGYFMALTDKYSTAGSAALKIIPNGCFYLDKFDLEENPLVGGKAHELKLGVMAKFKNPSESLGPVCGRVFNYKESEIEITALTGKPVPARKVQGIPHVWYHTMDGDESWKNDWYTLAYVANIKGWPEYGTPQRPLMHWLVTNIHGDDIRNGDCVVPYISAAAAFMDQEYVFLLYKQEEKVDIKPAQYGGTGCSFQYRCYFDVDKMVEENKLELVGAQNFKVAPDPQSIIRELKAGYLNTSTACQLLQKFPDEGKMIGQCLPKYTSWKDLWEKMEKAKDPEEKTKIIKQMNEMCPELAKDFSEEKMSEMEEMKEWMKKEMEEIAKKMKEKKGSEEEMKKKWFMHMLMKKMLEDVVYDDNDSHEKKKDDMYDDNDSHEKRKDDNDSHEKKKDDMYDDNDSHEKRKDDNDSAEKRGCGGELVDEMMKMKQGWDMGKGSWEDKEKEFGPCMMAVAVHLKKLHQEYVAKKEMEGMKDKFENFMKEKMTEFVKHMVVKKMSQHLGMSKCGDREGDDKPCADPEKLKMYLWHKYVMMKEKKQAMSGEQGSKDGWDEKYEQMEEIKKTIKEIMFFKSVLAMMDRQKEHYQDKKPDFQKFLENDPNWKRFCDDL